MYFILFVTKFKFFTSLKVLCQFWLSLVYMPLETLVCIYTQIENRVPPRATKKGSNWVTLWIYSYYRLTDYTFRNPITFAIKFVRSLKTVHTFIHCVIIYLISNLNDLMIIWLNMVCMNDPYVDPELYHRIICYSPWSKLFK